MSRRKSSRGRVLVSKTGRKNKKNIEDYKDTIRNDKSLTPLEKRAKLADLDDYINQRAKDNRSGYGKRLTTNGFEAFEKADGLERMFASVGMSADEIAARYGLDEQELLDPANWDRGVFTASNGDTYTFKHSYSGEVLV